VKMTEKNKDIDLKKN